MGRGTDKIRLAADAITAETGYGYMKIHFTIFPIFVQLQNII